MLNSEFFSRRPDVELRVYGFYREGCDLSFLRRMTNVRRFSADSLMAARNVEYISDMELESLGLGIFDLESFDVLERVTPTITRLYLGKTRSKRPSLRSLARFNLRELYVEGHKGIEVLSELDTLEDVTLRSITTDDLSYLRPLTNLASVDIKLGGIRSLSGIEGKRSIKYLELWQIRGFSDLSIVESLPGLQFLFLQDLPRITMLPSFRNSTALRRIHMQNIKGLQDFSELEWAPALEEFILFEGGAQDPEMLVPLLRNPSLRRAVGAFGSHRKDQRFQFLLAQHGIESFRAPPFEFR